MKPNPITFAFMCLLMLLSCTRAADLPTAILGKWQEIRADKKNATVEFYNSGTMTIICVQDNFTLTADYKVLDATTVKLIPAGDIGNIMGPQVLKFAVTADTLTMKYPEGKIEKYTRLK